MTGFVQRIVRFAGCLAVLLGVAAASDGFDLRPVAQILVDAVELVPEAPGSALVRFRAVDSEGEPVRNLRTVDVSLWLDEQELPGELRGELLSSERHPLSAVLAIDTSRTMMGRPLEEVRRLALALEADLGPRDRLAVVTVSDTVKVLADFRTPRSELRARLTALRVEEQAMTTVLWDGLAAAIDLLRRADTGGPVVLFSDGRDNGSQAHPADLLAASRAHQDRPQISILPVAYTGRGTRGRADLEDLASASGGILRDLDQIGASASSILRPRRIGYTLQFDADLDGASHHVQVGVESARGALVSRFPQLVRVAEAVSGPGRRAESGSYGGALALLCAGFLAGHYRTRLRLQLQRLRLHFVR
jgi:Mg-chelatase subunit ChlD